MLAVAGLRIAGRHRAETGLLPVASGPLAWHPRVPLGVGGFAWPVATWRPVLAGRLETLAAAPRQVPAAARRVTPFTATALSHPAGQVPVRTGHRVPQRIIAWVTR